MYILYICGLLVYYQPVMDFFFFFWSCMYLCYFFCYKSYIKKKKKKTYCHIVMIFWKIYHPKTDESTLCTSHRTILHLKYDHKLRFCAVMVLFKLHRKVQGLKWSKTAQWTPLCVTNRLPSIVCHIKVVVKSCGIVCGPRITL